MVYHEISHLSLVFSRYTHSPKGSCVYRENTSDSWHISWYTTQKRYITSMYKFYTRTKQTVGLLLADWAEKYKGLFLLNKKAAFTDPFGTPPSRAHRNTHGLKLSLGTTLSFLSYVLAPTTLKDAVNKLENNEVHITSKDLVLGM